MLRRWAVRRPLAALAALTALAAATAGASGSAPAPSPDRETAVTSPEPVTLVSFGPPAVPRWFVINDGVMGGLSRSSMQPTADDTGLFSGTLSLENNGGFASVRTQVAPGDLAAWDGLELRVRGDGRTYQLRLRTDDRFDGIAYRAEFPTLKGAWATVRLPFGDFAPVFRGRVLTDVPPLDLDGIEQVGLMLADKQPGPFSLEVEFVRTYVGAAGGQD